MFIVFLSPLDCAHTTVAVFDYMFLDLVVILPVVLLRTTTSFKLKGLLKAVCKLQFIALADVNSYNVT